MPEAASAVAEPGGCDDPRRTRRARTSGRELHRASPGRLAGPYRPGVTDTGSHEFPRYFHLAPSKLGSRMPGTAPRPGRSRCSTRSERAPRPSARRSTGSVAPPRPSVRRGAAPARRRRRQPGPRRCGRRVRSCRVRSPPASRSRVPGLTFDVSREAAAESRVGVSEMEWGLADTGTVVQDATDPAPTARLDASGDPRRAPSRQPDPPGARRRRAEARSGTRSVHLLRHRPEPDGQHRAGPDDRGPRAVAPRGRRPRR